MSGLSSYFVWLNRSKESLTLDLKQPGRADGPGPAARARRRVRAEPGAGRGRSPRHGAGRPARAAPASHRVRGVRLRLVRSVRPEKAYDLLVQSEAGLLSITGTPEAPSRVGISVADIAAGMYAYSGILTALLARATTGRGAALDVSLFDALAEWMGAPAYYTGMAGPRRRAAAPHTRRSRRTSSS